MIVFLIPIAEIIGCIAFLALVVIYFLCLIGGNGVLDQSLVASIFIATFAILIYNLFMVYFGLFKSKEKEDKIFSIISLILIVAAMIKGAIVPFNVGGFHYTYTLIPSMIQSTWLVNIIAIFLMYFAGDIYGFIKDKEFDGESFSSLRTIFLIYIGAIIASQLIFAPVVFFGGKDVAKKYLNYICYSYNVKDHQNLDKYDTPLEMANLSLDEYRNQLKDEYENYTDDYLNLAMNSYYDYEHKYVYNYSFSIKKVVKYTSGLLFSFYSRDTKETTKLFYDYETSKFIELDKETLKKKDEEFAIKRLEQLKQLSLDSYNACKDDLNSSSFDSNAKKYLEKTLSIYEDKITVYTADSKISYSYTTINVVKYEIIVNKNNGNIISAEYKITSSYNDFD